MRDKLSFNIGTALVAVSLLVITASALLAPQSRVNHPYIQHPLLREGVVRNVTDAPEVDTNKVLTTVFSTTYDAFDLTSLHLVCAESITDPIAIYVVSPLLIASADASFIPSARHYLSRDAVREAIWKANETGEFTLTLRDSVPFTFDVSSWAGTALTQLCE